MMSVESETASDEQRLRSRGSAALGELFAAHRDRLVRMIHLRMDPRLRGRFDPSDVIQDAFAEATNRVDEFLRADPMPPFLWLRLLVCQRFVALQRHHLGTAKRDAARDVSLFNPVLPDASSAMLAANLAANLTGPSEAAMRAELQLRIQSALETMDVLDREIIALRHYEQLTRTESALVLGIPLATASKRYLRAMRRLRTILEPES